MAQKQQQIPVSFKTKNPQFFPEKEKYDKSQVLRLI